MLALSVHASSHSIVTIYLSPSYGKERQLVNSRAKMGISHQNTLDTEEYLHMFHILLTPKQIRQVELRIIQAYCM